MELRVKSSFCYFERGTYNISDTGLKQRAILPLGYSKNGTVVIWYEGSTVGTNTRELFM